MSGGNQFHGRHINQFCDYADATAAGAAEEVKKEIPGVVQQEVSKQLSKQKVSVEVDKQSVLCSASVSSSNISLRAKSLILRL